MTNIFIWMMAAYGMSTIIVYGSIFDSARDFIHRWGKNEFAPFQGLGRGCTGYHQYFLTVCSPLEAFGQLMESLSFSKRTDSINKPVWVVQKI